MAKTITQEKSFLFLYVEEFMKIYMFVYLSAEGTHVVFCCY